MSRTKKEGKRSRGVYRKFETPDMGETVQQRHSFGHTEKILRRNRKIWTRLLNKQRRQLDKQTANAE